MKYYTRFITGGFAIILFLMTSGCETPTRSYDAITVGEEEDLIKKGDMSTHMQLRELQSKFNIYGLGTVTGLQGFIVINDGNPFTSFTAGHEIFIDSTWYIDATLLVYSKAEKWKELSIPADVKTYAELENFVMTKAKENKINLDVPFPFLLKGTANTVYWRIVDWDSEDKEVTNKKVKNSGVKGEAKEVRTTMVGFYCTKQYRVLAEHTTKMHLHFVSDDRQVSGHLDDIILDGRMNLFLPEDSVKVKPPAQ